MVWGDVIQRAVQCSVLACLLSLSLWNDTGSTLEWPAYDMQTAQTMYLQTPENQVVSNFLEDYCSFWDQIGYGY